MSNLKTKKSIQKCPVCKTKSMEHIGSVWFSVECMNCGFSFDGNSGVLYEKAIEYAKARLKAAKKENHE